MQSLTFNRRPRTPPSPSLESYSSLLDPAPESPSQYDLRDRGALRPQERYGFTVTALVEPATYREAVIHPD